MRGKVEILHQAFTVGLYGVLGVHMVNYLYSAIAKLKLDGSVGSWILHNPTQALITNGNQLGAAPLGVFPHIQTRSINSWGQRLSA